MPEVGGSLGATFATSGERDVAAPASGTTRLSRKRSLA
jgi:hypothetical protein